MVNFSKDKLQYPGAKYGLNTISPSFLLDKSEAAELLNFRILKDGSFQTRPPLVKLTTTPATGNATITRIARAVIGGTAYTLAVDINDELYYLNGTVLTSIGTLKDQAVVYGFNGVALICDGSYLKYLDGVTAIKLCWDGGTGASGFQFNNRSGDNDTTLALGNGTNTRIAYKFTSQTWDTGYTIPPLTFYAKLQREGDGYTGTDNVPVTVKLRLVSDDSILATKTLKSTATSVSTTATEYSVTFSDSDITTEMGPGVAYYATLEYSNGDASHYIKVCCTTATAGTAYVYAGAWAADATKTPIVAVSPGRPPKASFGVPHNGRPFVAGDPDNKGYVWYGNRTHLDWSSTDGGGYVGVVDDNANNFEVGAIDSLYGELYIFGKEDQPYISQLTGDTPSEYAAPVTFQRAWTTHDLLINTVNDLWFFSSDGADALSGVQEYGDLRVTNYSEKIQNKFKDYWSSSSVAGYYPKHGQLWITFPGHPKTFIFHIKNPVPEPGSQKALYPASSYEFYRDIFTSDDYIWAANGDEYCLQAAAGGDPSIATQPDFITLDGKECTEGTAGSLNDHEWDYALDPTGTYYTVHFKDDTGDPDTSGVTIKSILQPKSYATFGDTIYLGGSDGHIYKVDDSEYKDLTTNEITFDWRGKYYMVGMGYITIIGEQIIVAGKFGAQLTTYKYKNDQQRSSVKSHTYRLTIDDRLTVAEMTMDVGDAYFLVDPQGGRSYKRYRVQCRSFQARITNVLLSGAPITFKGMFFPYIKAGK